MGELPKKIRNIAFIVFAAVLISGCDMPFNIMGQDEPSEIDTNNFVENSEDVPPLSQPDENTPAEGTIAEDGTIILGDNIVSVNLENVGRTSPFVPYKERNLLYGSDYTYNDMPLPSILGENEDALIKLVSAKVTGIIYDKVTPYAIINVLDNDYLVKIGDKIESFSITDIEKDYVAIKTGTNVYRAKVGDIIEGDINESGIYNVGHRFAGTKSKVKDEDVIFIKGIKKDEVMKNNNFTITDLILPPIPSTNNVPNSSGNSGNNLNNSNNITAGDDDVPPPPTL